MSSASDRTAFVLSGGASLGAAQVGMLHALYERGIVPQLIALHALTLLTQSRLIADVELHRDRAKLIVLPPPCPLGIQPIDFGHADELIERSLADARAFLDRGGAGRPPTRRRNQRRGQPRARKKHPAVVG
jgi:NTE family protein